MTRVIVKVGVALALVWAVVVMGARAVGEWLPPGEEIAFAASKSTVDYQASRPDIYRIDITRHMIVNLTRSEHSDFSPTWSPDGTHIAYVSYHEIANALYTMNADGSEVRQLTNGETYVSLPEYSPTGDEIVYLATDQNRIRSTVQVLDVASGHVRQITDTLPRQWPIHWSPDGHHISFTSEEPKGRFIDMRSGEETFIDGIFPTFSPDFSQVKVAYIQNDTGFRIMRITDLHNNRISQLFSDLPIYSEPAWPPDGLQIAFVGNAPGGGQLFVANMDGTLDRSLPMMHALDGIVPRWTPDGEAIIVNSVSALYILHLGTGTVERLTFDLFPYEGNFAVRPSKPLFFHQTQPLS